MMQYNKNAHRHYKIKKKTLRDCRFRTLVLNGHEWSTSCSGYLNKERFSGSTAVADKMVKRKM